MKNERYITGLCTDFIKRFVPWICKMTDVWKLHTYSEFYNRSQCHQEESFVGEAAQEVTLCNLASASESVTSITEVRAIV